MSVCSVFIHEMMRMMKMFVMDPQTFQIHNISSTQCLICQNTISVNL